VPLPIGLAKARSQRWALGHGLAQSLGIAWLFVPASAPTLQLLARFWQCVNKTCRYSQYYAAHLSCQQAILACIAPAPNRPKEEVASCLPVTVQSCKEVPVIGEASNGCLLPVARQTKRKVSSKAA
jgi:hypothetical protein